MIPTENPKLNEINFSFGSLKTKIISPPIAVASPAITVRKIAKIKISIVINNIKSLLM